VLPKKTDDAIMKLRRMVHWKVSFLVCFLLPKQIKNHGEWKVTIRLFLYFKGAKALFNSLALDHAVFCWSLRLNTKKKASFTNAIADFKQIETPALKTRPFLGGFKAIKI
jgi:hypothetical protein